MDEGPAWEALRFAIRSDAADQHAFVRGLIDTRRKALTLEALSRMQPPPAPAPDRAYVRNMKEPHRPRLLALRQGTGRAFAESVRRLAVFIRDSNTLRGGAATRARRLEVRESIEKRARPIRARFADADALSHLDAVVVDAVERRFASGPGASGDPVALYGVNVVVCRESRAGKRPVVVEEDPSPAKLLGTFTGDAGKDDDHARIRPGAFVQADGGYIVLDASRIASSSSWQALLSTLRRGTVELSLQDRSAALRPEPIPVRIRVILIGDRTDYRALDDKGPEFAHHFKVLADIDRDMARDAAGFRMYTAMLADLARAESRLPFHRTAVAALIEQGARIAGRAGRITARMGRIADVAREADYVAREARRPAVGAVHVHAAVQRTKERGSLDARRFLEFVEEGATLIEVTGEVVGQVNGLSVIHAGPITYGFPARITASVGAGREGIFDIESRAELSGSIHTKGFQIFQGLLRRLLETDHPLAFTASLASEQTYGRVDGDSSSAAQLCCLLSALARVPIRQCLAATGAIDQLGHVQSVGCVDEKIEGFFDVCELLGLDGKQGVVIPRANAGDLMLRDDVVRACARGRFQVFAVSTIYELLTLMTGIAASPPRADGTYVPGSVLELAVAGSTELWEETVRRPARRV